jgi:excisionase family DNA binding protein
MHTSTISKMEVTPILVSVPQAAQMLGRGVSTIYDLIGGGKIRAVKSDGRTLVVVASLHEYANNLPAAQIAPPRQRKPQRMREAETTNA